MGVPGYLYSDWITALAVSAIAITSEDSTNYPETNLQNENVALATRTTAKVAIKLQVDLGSAKAPQIFAILNHNFSGGTYDINSYTAADFATGKTTVESAKAIRALDMYHREASAPTARQYWEWDFTNCTSADSYFEIGRAMMFSDRTALTYAEDFVRGRGYGYRNIINQTAFGTRWVHKLTEKRERFELAWGTRLSTTIATEMRTLYETVYGDAHPFLFIPDITGTDCYYGYLEQPELMYQEMYATVHTGGITMRFIEAVRGKV